jgi:hypothetical protein
MINDIQIHTNGSFTRQELMSMPVRDFVEIKDTLHQNVDRQNQQISSKGKRTTTL